MSLVMPADEQVIGSAGTSEAGAGTGGGGGGGACAAAAGSISSHGGHGWTVPSSATPLTYAQVQFSADEDDEDDDEEEEEEEEEEADDEEEEANGDGSGQRVNWTRAMDKSCTGSSSSPTRWNKAESSESSASLLGLVTFPRMPSKVTGPTSVEEAGSQSGGHASFGPP